jgi:hypothetical protein
MAPLRTEPVYDEDFKKIGEKLLCGFCKTEYGKDDVPFVQEKKPEKASRTADETCEYCENFVKNIFYQKCTLKNKPVDIYDSCDSFKKKQVKKKPF